MSYYKNFSGNTVSNQVMHFHSQLLVIQILQQDPND